MRQVAILNRSIGVGQKYPTSEYNRRLIREQAHLDSHDGCLRAVRDPQLAK
jgi:hypothetical protein